MNNLVMLMMLAIAPPATGVSHFKPVPAQPQIVVVQSLAVEQANQGVSLQSSAPICLQTCGIDTLLATHL